MKPRTVLSVVLLGFVAASVVFLVVKGTGSDDASTTGAKAQAGTMEQAGTRVTVYYFHGNVRCTTCRNIESYAREAVKPLASDRLEWRTMNVDEPSNKHYVMDYKLVTRSVVLSETVDGKEKRWKNLDRVWDLVRDKKAFISYIQAETRSFLGENAI